MVRRGRTHYASGMRDSYLGRVVSNDERIKQIVRSARRVAVLGIKTEAQAQQPAFYVPQYLASVGIDIVPVPVYYPDVVQILGRPVHRRLTEIQGEVDIVNVFRRPEDLPAHVDDILAKHPPVVWFQSGIRNDEVAEHLAREGIEVVQDRCIMVEHRRAR
jgi:predicted CoA-binding protein